MKQDMRAAETIESISIPPSFVEKKKAETIQNISELCLMMICIIHFEGGEMGGLLISIPGSLVSADYKRPVSSAVQATKKRLSKGRKGLSS